MKEQESEALSESTRGRPNLRTLEVEEGILSLAWASVSPNVLCQDLPLLPQPICAFFPGQNRMLLKHRAFCSSFTCVQKQM